ncbi:MAG: YhgE/Pip family protein [Ruminococcus sp.]|nr:YhgE/Pip family protein [Ruminococcus sp.]
MIVCIKTKFSEKEMKKLGNPKPYHMFLGRLMTYLAFAVVQSLIIGVGDLLIMDIQCYNVFLFLFACVFIGIVFTIIIYTFQFSFGDIGKAIIVITMILQIGATGGLYPIECVPEFFQNLYPYLPFTYAINAIRECVSGFYGADFWKYILCLVVYIPIMLLIGLVIRLPFAKLINHFEESKERSDIIL